ncbi:VWA domain-containing protein [Ideonella livida]|uniref:VWA domain-containing protein n=1 Tax=Ideonella livida TaxID=2707176 RepID=A0A7C9TMK2_9BURK|nr:VWA domain-containing protein [Ideonella livida]NDY91746.1 VWA domain-containing protein [Ideonella livida]
MNPPVPDATGLDAPYHQLAPLPRGLWLPALVAAVGDRADRLAHVRHWLEALVDGRLPPEEADWGERETPRAGPSLRAVVAALGLPALCRGVPDLAQQVLRTLLWHLDRLPDLQPALSRAAAVQRVTDDFRAAWTDQTHGLQDDLALLQGLGDLAHLRWDALRGHLNARPWQAARRAADWLAQMPELAALIQRLGRSEPVGQVSPRPAPRQPGSAGPPVPLRPVVIRLPDAPGEITGIRLAGQPERMLASQALMLHHPVLRKLWRARFAEARLLCWDTEAQSCEGRPDPAAARQAPSAPDRPQALERGPMIVCLDTSGSMRGAPENVAKAVVIAALRAAHATRRGCLLLAFGGPDEVLEQRLDQGEAGLQALLDLMGRSFDGGTDVQTPIERAIERVHEDAWRGADLLIVSDGEFGCVPQTLARLDAAREHLGLRVQGVLVGDRETLGLLEVCDAIHWVRDWRRYAEAAEQGAARPGAPAAGGFSPVHSKSLTALYFPNALSGRAQRHHRA